MPVVAGDGDEEREGSEGEGQPLRSSDVELVTRAPLDDVNHRLPGRIGRYGMKTRLAQSSEDSDDGDDRSPVPSASPAPDTLPLRPHQRGDGYSSAFILGDDDDDDEAV